MVKRIIAAIQFLTILPVPVKTRDRNLGDLEKSIPWFPLAGALTGFITGYGNWVLGRLFPVQVSVALTIVLYMILTRGLHLDGYMDTIDGFLSHRGKDDREVILRIMKEPGVGSFAVLGVVTWALVLYSALPYLEPLDYVVVHVLARFSIVPLPLLFSYPRESGTGKFFADNVKAKTVIASSIVTVVILAAVFFLKGRGAVFFALEWLKLAVLSFLLAVVIGRWSKRKISGVTGDVLGFTIEIVHVVLVLVITLTSIHG